ncbi:MULTISPECIES: rod-binding protein [Pseudovibrio]|uniref:rod-binding protein n=1 Tax=Stappiaceae TaxID=2821832 RepID=UPI0023669AEC|nr:MULTISPECIES: rod-binding protein [Pseudovibrio]MDD7908993.1 rod-binding protein [Pseudovibrio exalbescens]MDX5593686.1 rod-binding protein [Pseudovibrio sp. SPO723]
MAVSPVGDLVLDVLKQADPLEASSARETLAKPVKVSADLPIAGEQADWASAMSRAEKVGPAASGVGLASSGTPVETLTSFAQHNISNRTQESLGERLEAAVLQTFVKSMLPREMESFFGSGTAGHMWKGLMAEQLATQMARSGGIGLAEKLVPESLQTETQKGDA